MWKTRNGTHNAVQSLFIILMHRLLHMRALLAKRNGGEQAICPVHHGSLLDSQLLHQERATHGHRYGKKPGDHEYFTANSLKKKCKNRHFLGIHDRFIRDEKFRKSMIELGRTEEVCREMDKLANEDHTHHLTPDEARKYRNIWWIRPNFVGSITTPVRHRADQVSIVNIVTAQRPRWCSSSAKMDEKLFFVLVELARMLVAFILSASPRRRTQHWLVKENLIEMWLGHFFEVWF